MPISDEPQIVPNQTYQISVPMPDAAHMFVGVTIQNDGQATDPDMDETLQSLIDLLQGWPGKHPGGDVTGQKYSLRYFNATPTNPVPPPPE